ncbi:MAG TPA: hypothetical protein ENI52_01635 [Thermoplasmata archaeon]|nr:hypothetical protein [Thermoplasmata archaeon]
MLWDGDVDKVKKLMKQAERVIKKGFAIAREPFEKRLQLWNEIKESYEKYQEGEYGKFLDDLDKHYRSRFEVALLILARAFIKNSEEFPPSHSYSQEEIETYERIEKYNVFEILTTDDIKKKIVAKDRNLLGLFEEYYVEMDRWADEIIENPEIRLELRYYLKDKWENYKNKINEAVNELIKELDWFRILINKWSQETEKIAEGKAEERIEEEMKKIEEERKQIEEEKEKLQKIIEEIRGMKEKIDEGSRFVELGEAKFYENNFIGRLKNKLRGEIEIDGKKFVVEDIKEEKIENVYKYAEKLDHIELKNLPENKCIIAKFVERKILRRGREIILKAIFCSRIGKLAHYKFDTDPLKLNEINPYFTETMDMAKGEQMILCIASPTGFAKEVEERIIGEDFHKNFISNFSVCLVDMETGKLLYNPHDELAKKLKRICMLETNEELVAKVKNCIEEMLVEKNHVTLDEAIKICGDKKLVKKVFYDLEDEKNYRVRYVKEIGLVLVGR